MRKRLIVAVIAAGTPFLAEAASAAPGLSSSEPVKSIIKAIRANTQGARLDIYELERQVHDRPSEAAEALVDLLDTSDPTVKLRASQLLERLSSNQDFSITDSSLSTIIGILKASDDNQVKSALITTLGNIGPKTDEVKATIIEIVKTDKEVSVARKAIEALARLAREERPTLHMKSTEVLVAVLNSNNAPSLRAAAASALSRYHSNAKIAVPALTAALNDNYLRVRIAAVQALGLYSGDGDTAIPALLEMLASESDPSMRNGLIYALKNLGRNNQDVAKAFMKLLDGSTSERSQILTYLSDFGPLMAPLTPRLIEMLGSPDRNTRMYAARTLGSIGSAAKDAVPALTKAQEDTDGSVRSYAQQALRNIQGGQGTM